MKIGIDISQIIYGTGVSVYTKNLVENLLSLEDTNEYVLFGSSLRRKEELEKFAKGKKAQSKILPLPPSLLELLWNKFHFLPVENLIGKVDIIHTSDWLEPPSRCPKITTIHDLVVYKYPESLPKKIIENQKRKLAWVKKESQAVIAVSENTKQDIIEILGIPEAKIKVVYEAPAEIYKKQNIRDIENVKTKYKLSNRYILSIGTQEPRKNIERLIKAFLLMEKDFPDLELILVGKYGWGDKVEIKNNKIRLLGFIPFEELPSLYAGSSCFAYPSLYEGFGLPILEAMASGAPVVTSGCSSMAEIANGSAVLIDPKSEESIAEGIAKALKDSKDYINKGLIRASEFSWRKTAEETLHVYMNWCLK